MNSIVIVSIKRQIVFIYHDPKFCVSSLEIHFFYFQKKKCFWFSITCCEGICIFCSMLSAYILQKLKNDLNSLAYSLYDVINDCPRAFYWAWLPCKRVCLAIVRTCAQLDRLREKKDFFLNRFLFTSWMNSRLPKKMRINRDNKWMVENSKEK